MEIYNIDDYDIYVKRDDLIGDGNKPPFSKIRGLYERLEVLKSQGYENIGYVETSISMAGWGVSWVCKELGLKSIIYNPIYKNEQKNKKAMAFLNYHRKKWIQNGAEVVDIPAGRAKVNFYKSRKELNYYYDNSIMLELGLPLEETVKLTSKELIQTQEIDRVKSLVVSVGSGTILSGIIRGLSYLCKDIKIYGVLCRKTNNLNHKLKVIRYKALGEELSGIDLSLIDNGWEYSESSYFDCPFKTHPFYDLKAWEWLNSNLNIIEHPVMFWNIGRSPDELL